MKIQNSLLLVFAVIAATWSPAHAKDGRDRALPDQYECPGCGGWEKYRADLAKQEQEARRERSSDRDEEAQRMLREQRRENDLLEEQNELLRERNEYPDRRRRSDPYWVD